MSIDGFCANAGFVKNLRGIGHTTSFNAVGNGRFWIRSARWNEYVAYKSKSRSFFYSQRLGRSVYDLTFRL